MKDKNVNQLNRENQKLYASLKGEYKIYAWQLLNALFVHCKPKSAINDSLSDIFSMLADAQNGGCPFMQIIPDPRTSIRETVLCFPQKRIRRRMLAALISAAALVLLAGILAATLTPVPLDEPIIRFDDSELTLSWQEVPHAQGYEVYADDELIGTTRETQFSLPVEYAQRQTIYFSVTATGEGRWRDTSGTHFYKTEEKELTLELTLSDLYGENRVWEEGSVLLPANTFSSITVTLTPFYSLCVVPEGDILRIIDERGAAVPKDGICILQAETAYSFTIVPVSDRKQVGMKLGMLNPLSFATTQFPSLPQGTTIFSPLPEAAAPEYGAQAVEDNSRTWLATHSAQGFTFGCLPDWQVPSDSLFDYQPDFYSTFCMLGELGTSNQGQCYWLVTNTTNREQKFAPEEVITPIALAKGQEMNFEKGWSTFILHPQHKPEWFYLWYDYVFTMTVTDNLSHIDCIMFCTPHNDDEQYYLVLPDNQTGFQGNINMFLSVLSQKVPYLITIYWTKSVSAVCSYFTMADDDVVTEEILAQGEITLPPGLTLLSYENNGDMILGLSSERWFYAFRPPMTTYELDIHTLTDYRSFFTDGKLFVINPYREPLTFNLTPYFPSQTT